MGVDLVGGHLFCLGGDIDVLFATISSATMTGSRSWVKNFFVFLKVVYSTMSLHEGVGMKWYTNLNTK